MLRWLWYAHFWLTRVTGVSGPLLFLAALYHTLIHPHSLDRYFLHLPTYLPASTTTGPLLPTSRAHSWQLGYLAALVNASSIDPAAALAQAAALLNAPPSSLNLTTLSALGAALAAHEAHKTPWSKLLGLWSFVNVMWALSILGITATISPVLYLLFGPLIARLFATLRALLLLAHHLARPAYNLAALHISASFLLSAPHYPPAVAPFLALTGAALALPALSLSLTQLRLPVHTHTAPYTLTPDSSLAPNRNPPPPPPPRYSIPIDTYTLLHSTLLNLFAAATLTLAALPLSSTLLAFLATAALFAALGFGITPFCCGWSVGFGSRSSIVHCSLSSTILIILLLAATHAGPPFASHAALFSPGVSIMGGCALGVAGLILTSRWGHYREPAVYVAANTAFALVCLLLLVAAAVLHVTPLRCTATVFLALWLSQKVIEVKWGEAFVVVVFVGSLALWRLSFFLKGHPEYLLSLFDMFDLRAQ